MAKFRKKLKSKGKRWVKGQSSVTNPDSKKYRSQAQINFCKPIFGGTVQNEGKSLLTQNKLKEHDNITNSYGFNKSKPDDVMSHTSASTYKTFETFASDWSSCTNPSFNRLLKNFSSNSYLHKEMLAILAALTEVIKANGGKETSTEYFAALITTLQTTLSNGQDDCEDSVTAMVSLLSMGMKCVPKEVLCTKFGTTTQTLLTTLAKFAESDNNNLLKSVLSCLSLLLRIQEKIVWSHSSTVQVYDAILNFIIHSKPKIRKAAQHAVCAILKSNKDLMHPISGYTATYCTKVLTSGTTASNTTTVLHVLTLLKELMPIFPKKELKPLCEEVLKLMTLNHPLLLSCGFQVFHGLFVSYPSSELVLTSTLNAKLLMALFDYRPTPIDTQPTLAWLAVQQEAYICLSKSDLSLCISQLKRIFKVCIELWVNGNTELLKASGSTLRILIEECIGHATDSTYHQSISVLFNLVTQCLSYQYKNACSQVLHTLSTFFKFYGKCAPSIFLECIKSLGQLRDSNEITFVNELEMTIGAGIKYIGPEYIISDKVIPLKVDDVGEFKRSWLLPVLKDSISNSTLKCYIDHFLPLALKCREMYENALKANDKITAISYDLLESQIWALLASFCSNPSDISTSFRIIARTMGTMLSSRKELRDTILVSLRKLIASVSKNDDVPDDKEQLSYFAKNFLPICLNLYTNPAHGTDEQATRFSALETIKMYLTLSDDEIKEQLFNKCCGMLDNSKDADHTVIESILDIIGVLVPYQSVKTLKSFFDSRISKAKQLKNFKEEKKYFRILEEICSSKSLTCNKFVKKNFENIQNFILSTAQNAAATSRGPRLRCLAHLLDHTDDDNVIQSILTHLPEAVLCCKGSTVNKRCRECAFSLINKMALLAIKVENGLENFLNALSAGLAGSIPMMSCTILALASVLHNRKDEINSIQFETILSNICLLITTGTREVVSSALSFIKVMITSFSDGLMPYLSTILSSLSKMTDDCKRKFRQETKNIYQRLVRKFGTNLIIQMVPNTDVQTHVRLRALNKESERLKRNKEKRTKEKINDKVDVDFSLKTKPKTFEEILAECEEDDELETNLNQIPKAKQEKGRKKKSADNYLHESEDDILDFTEATSNRKILMSKPKSEHNTNIHKLSSVDDSIKTAPDGRLIITDEPQAPTKSGIDEEDVDDNDSDNDMPSKKRLKYTPGGKGIHRPFDKNLEKGRINKQVKKNKMQNEGQGSYNKNKGKKSNGNVRPFSYTDFKSYGASNKKKRKRN
ncbi:RRP12-like protein isoform X2 [Acyrthosiphon pisum]|uniref:RRP12-like protein n=1 Tax=Acyrthosiphon pisum TaxID=7029 RepID=A0A8R2B6C1_ACYPI|nr:RRP12-like protein isoform X2 [Acyrthosiphon pisum]|eukprot:XP_008183768.1 PREDICTED: RRP12-like protein isoform X2 [Acyrthosiphon pisum]